MAGRGPMKKPADQRRRRNVGPDLPAALAGPPPPLPLAPSGDPWPDQVHDWYNTWAETYGDRFDAVDWQNLRMLAPVVLDYFSTFDRGVLSEIRIHEDGLRRRALTRRPATPETAAPRMAAGASRHAGLKVVG